MVYSDEILKEHPDDPHSRLLESASASCPVTIATPAPLAMLVLEYKTHHLSGQNIQRGYRPGGLDDGCETQCDIVVHSGGVAIVPLLGNEIALVRQFRYYSSVGFTNERMSIFPALDLGKVEKRPEWDERIQMVRMPIAEML